MTPLLIAALALGGVATVGTAAIVLASPAKKSVDAAKGHITPKPYGKPYGAIVPSGKDLPETSPDGAPWLFWHGHTKLSFGGTGLDASGTFWAYGAIPFTNSIPGCSPPSALKCSKPSDIGFFIILPKDISGSSFLDDLREAVTNYVLPALAVAASAVIPGVGGVVASAIIIAASKMAKGASITSVLVSATQDALPSLRDNRAFSDAYEGASALYAEGKSHSEVTALVEKVRAKFLTPEQKTAYDQGVAMALGQRRQIQAIGWLKKEIASKSVVIDLAMTHGAALIDVADVLGGDYAVGSVSKILQGQPVAVSPSAVDGFHAPDSIDKVVVGSCGCRPPFPRTNGFFT